MLQMLPTFENLYAFMILEGCRILNLIVKKVFELFTHKINKDFKEVRLVKNFEYIYCLLLQ